MRQSDKTFVISVGGSLVVGPDGPNLKFLEKFRNFVLDKVEQGFRFYLVVGGGRTARTYTRSAVSLGHASDADRDLIGIRATRLNAELLRVVLGNKSTYSEIVTDPRRKINTRKPVVLAGGFKPGRSTDYVAVMMARQHGAKTLINLSNIDYVYDRDPKLFPDSKKLKELTWTDFRAIVGNRWVPGSNLPFDPVASRLASTSNLRVAIINGQKLKNLEQCMLKEKFIGTMICN